MVTFTNCCRQPGQSDQVTSMISDTRITCNSWSRTKLITFVLIRLNYQRIIISVYLHLILIIVLYFYNCVWSSLFSNVKVGYIGDARTTNFLLYCVLHLKHTFRFNNVLCTFLANMDEDLLDQPHYTIARYELFITKCINGSIHQCKSTTLFVYVNIIIIMY